MPSREELKALIDQLPEGKLELVEMIFRARLNPLNPRPEHEAMVRRSEEYRDRVMQRFQEHGRPGCGGGIGSSSGVFSENDGMAYGSHEVQYWDGRALVLQTTHYYGGHEIEIMERFSIESDQMLYCGIELSSGGKTVRHADAFPMRAR